MLKRIFGTMYLLGLTTQTLAQETPAAFTRYLVTTDHVKPELVTVWQDLQKNEVVPALFSSAYRAAAGHSADYMNFLRDHMQSPMHRAVDSGFIPPI